jgi:hypothetical protein
VNDEPQVIEGETTALVPVPPQELEYLTPVMDLETAKKRLEEFQQFVKSYLAYGEDYGRIPGTQKDTLLKPGADKLAELYGLSDTYREDRVIEDWEKRPPLFDYRITCVLKRRGQVITEAAGSCSSYESKYKYREQLRICPTCGKDTIIKGKKEYGSGWLCFAKKGGCGAKFPDNHPKIASQTVGRVPNPDIADLKNTVLKMAYKRAKVAATIAATRSSGIFTQDMEDITGEDPGPNWEQRREELNRMDENLENQKRITQKQADAFIEAIRKRNKTRGQVSKFLKELNGYRTADEILVQDYAKAMEWVGKPPEDLTEIGQESVDVAKLNKQLHAAMDKHNVSNDYLHEFIEETYHVKHTNELTVEQMGQTIRWVDAQTP